MRSGEKETELNQREKGKKKASTIRENSSGGMGENKTDLEARKTVQKLSRSGRLTAGPVVMNEM